MKARRTQEFRLGVSVLMAGRDISGLSSRAQLAIVSEAIRRVKGKSLAKRIWTPQPGAQYDGYICEADELFYGGSAGGGKTDLLLGLAFYHKNSIIFRRQFAHLKAITSRSKELLRHVNGASYNGQLRIWNGLPGDRTLEFGAVQYEEDKENYQGQAHDLKAFDEITQFTETQYLYLTAWNRSAVKGQRSRIVCTGNPPQYESGQWVIERWGAWLDPKHPNPAQPGELRWYTMIDDEEQEYTDGTPFMHNGEQVIPKSRTFIPASLSDNAYLRDTDYRARLQSLPEPLRSQLLFGDFQIGFQDHAFQVIPTEWVYAAMRRRTDPAHRRDEKIPLTSLGVDVARGGEDQTIIAKVFGDWVDELTKHLGTATPDGSIVADYVEAEHQGQALINIDSIGIGASPFDILNERGLPVRGINAGERSEVRDKTDEFGFKNKRAEMWWRLREMLEPGSGRELVLPDDRELLGDLCAPRYKATSQGIQIESKDDIKKRLGRSTDCGDALVMALHEHMPMPPPASSSYSVSVDDLLAG